MANTIHFQEDSPIRDCYGWGSILDGEDNDSNSNQDLAIPDKWQGKISDDTRRMMDQQFFHPAHTSEGNDFMGLEDILNDVLRGLGDTMVFDPAAWEVEGPQPVHKDGASYDSIMQAQTIERHNARLMLQWSSSVS